MLGRIASRAATNLSYNKRSSCRKVVTTANNWSFELGVGGGFDVPIYVVGGFVQRDQFNQQHQKNTFYRRSTVNAKCINGSEKYPDAGKNCIFHLKKYLQA